MIESRNLTSHNYDETMAQQVIKAIRQNYIRQFDALERRMQALREEEVDGDDVEGGEIKE